MEQVRWGIIGCGGVVMNKSGPALARSRGSRVVSVMGRSGGAAQAYAQAQGIPKWPDDAGTLLGDPEVDIVYVATPPSSHAEYVLAAAEAGKHVLVEKPMAMSAEEGERMCAACEAAGVQLFVAYYRRFQPHVVEMRRMVQSGELGAPVQAFIDIAAPPPEETPDYWRTQPEISGGGLFIDVGAHRVDAMISIFGPPRGVTGFASRFGGKPGIERCAALSLSFDHGVLCAVTGDFHSGRQADCFEIHGTRGRVTADPLDGHLFSIAVDGHADLSTHKPFPAPHLGLLSHIEAVLAGECENTASGRGALETERVLDVVRGQVG